MAFQLRAGSQPVDGQLLAFLRLFCMTKKSLGKTIGKHFIMAHVPVNIDCALLSSSAVDWWLQSDHPSNLMHEECGIETEVESKAWSFLKARCQLLLQLYPTTKEVMRYDRTSDYFFCCLLRSIYGPVTRNVFYWL